MSEHFSRKPGHGLWTAVAYALSTALILALGVSAMTVAGLLAALVLIGALTYGIGESLRPWGKPIPVKVPVKRSYRHPDHRY